MPEVNAKNALLSKQEVAVAYALIERLAPFPCEGLGRHAPLQYKFSQAIARATSCHPGCAHTHFLTLSSARLNAVKMNYSDLLGVFPNLMFILTGASGDGKSIPLWLDTMVMHMLRKKEHQVAMKGYASALADYKAVMEGPSPPDRPLEEPKAPKEVDELYDAGTTVGLGQMMKATGGRAVWLKHETRKLLRRLMEGGSIGSFDELNQVAEHAYYRNSPANENSKFSIENPHMVALWLIHIEELLPFFHGKAGSKEDEDTVSGLMRFFIVHFPPVINKLLPAGTPAEIEKLVETDEYFNKLSFDQIASAWVNVLLILGRLYQQYQPREDEQNRPARYSKLLGLHTLEWEADAWEAYVGDFNACTDRVRLAHTKIRTRIDVAKLSKDKTRLLQFVPTIDLLEKVIRFLLPNTLTDPQISALTPEELVQHLAEAKIDDILGVFKPDTVSGGVTRNSVEAAKVLTKFYTKQFKLHEDLPLCLEAHRKERQHIRYWKNPRLSNKGGGGDGWRHFNGGAAQQSER